MNIYENILKQNISRILSLFNLDKLSNTYGYADRSFWGWKNKDFVNGTLQGATHSLAIALKLNLFNKTQEHLVLEIIDSSFVAIDSIKKENGSLVESYPNENSFCVTALVAFDLLSTIYYLNDVLTSKKKDYYLNTIKPLINFIIKNDEEHAIISNHLATAVAAIVLWKVLTNNETKKDEELLNIIYKHQSSEGWYKEYEGADHGYQTLCTYYLSCVYNLTKDKILLQSLKKSAKFLKYFIHPDGTIGGLYGSRNTEVYYPGGIIALSNIIEDFSLIGYYLEPNSQHILPQYIDIENFIPLINSYATAAINYNKDSQKRKTSKRVLFYENKNEKDFPEAGIYLYANKNYFVILNYKKGGTLKVFNKHTNQIDCEDGGIFGILNNKLKFTSQKFDPTLTFTNKTLISNLYLINELSITPFKFIILRLFSLTLFRSTKIGTQFKKLIVKKLMTNKKKTKGQIKREFNFYEKKIIVKETLLSSNNLTIKHMGKSKAIHMASSGYFVMQDYYNKEYSLVEFI